MDWGRNWLATVVVLVLLRVVLVVLVDIFSLLLLLRKVIILLSHRTLAEKGKQGKRETKCLPI